MRKACLLLVALIALGATSCGGLINLLAPSTPPGESDVPYFAPRAWGDHNLFNVRAEAEGSPVLLLTAVSFESNDTDDDDGILGNGPHSAVYRFNPATALVRRVEDEAWDAATTVVAHCPSYGSPDYGCGGDSPVGDESFVSTIFCPPTSRVVAQLSATNLGHATFIFGFVVPPEGQHHHQLFDERGPTPIGERLRIRNGSFGPLRACWSADEKHVIYFSERPFGIREISLVYVGDAVAALPPQTPGVSDVPCFTPDAWGAWPEEEFSDPNGYYVVRPETEGSDVFLFTNQTPAQWREDRKDEVVGNVEHGPVYRVNMIDGSAELVEASAWEEALAPAASCPSFSNGGRSVYEPPGVDLGENRLVDVDGSPTPNLAALLYTDGLPAGYRRHGTGQHYHQLYSESDEALVGDPVRVRNVHNGSPAMCWTRDSRYVLYAGDGRERFAEICIVRVAELVADFVPPVVVPPICFSPESWPDTPYYDVRAEAAGSGVLLLTSLTPEQRAEDDADGMVGNGPHGPVYRFDPASASAELVDSSTWESATGVAARCPTDPVPELPAINEPAERSGFFRYRLACSSADLPYELEARYTVITAARSGRIVDICITPVAEESAVDGGAP